MARDYHCAGRHEEDVVHKCQRHDLPERLDGNSQLIGEALVSNAQVDPNFRIADDTLPRSRFGTAACRSGAR
jgi:hypothetical protein